MLGDGLSLATCWQRRSNAMESQLAGGCVHLAVPPLVVWVKRITWAMTNAMSIRDPRDFKWFGYKHNLWWEEQQSSFTSQLWFKWHLECQAGRGFSKSACLSSGREGARGLHRKGGAVSHRFARESGPCLSSSLMLEGH